MGIKNKTTVIITGLLFCVIGWNIYQDVTSPKSGYILITEVYSGFEMKKEMEKKYLQAANARDKLLDCLALEVKVLGGKIERDQQKNEETIKQFENKRQEFFQRKQTYEEDNNALSKQYDQEILTQLNQYVKDFGEQQGYTYIHGNDGNGSLMYAQEARNITKEVIEFINNKYKGIE
ncbi:MAG: OmpH family outer membrane protein [Bacteroidota bacterium]